MHGMTVTEFGGGATCTLASQLEKSGKMMYNSNERNYTMGRRFGFTLAEVLITLAIIGVVAALTIPTLVQGYKKKVYSTRLKNFYSIMSQAIILSEIDNGPKNMWEKHATSDNYNPDGTLNADNARNNSYDFFVTYLAPYLKYSKETIKKNATFYLLDGTKVSMWNGSCVDLNVDVNGTQEPNLNGSDIYYFTVCLSDDELIKPGYGSGLSREDLLKYCKENYAFCTQLLFLDNWEFKEDYPYKL